MEKMEKIGWLRDLYGFKDGKDDRILNLTTTYICMYVCMYIIINGKTSCVHLAKMVSYLSIHK